ncbi:MAG: hypothetical protein NZM18_11420 [Thermoflexales bacterium]|nr:hypothetical protein [Thermoflexales bacterium]MDW8351053.1 hypothetical protein [Anaerolineae bacterium]
MNPFTRSIAVRLRSRRLKEFIERWDALEGLVIRVYRGAIATEADEAEFTALRRWLREHYPEWQARLEPHWRSALRGGRPSQDDPFVFLLAPERAAEFCGSWPHMQALPAAREALNRLIIAEQQT